MSEGASKSLPREPGGGRAQGWMEPKQAALSYETVRLTQALTIMARLLGERESVVAGKDDGCCLPNAPAGKVRRQAFWSNLGHQISDTQALPLESVSIPHPSYHIFLLVNLLTGTVNRPIT